MATPTGYEYIFAWAEQWWPAAILLAIAYIGLRIMAADRSSTPQLDAARLAIHEIRTTLACSEHQAKQLLAIYNGDSTKAINEVKTGKAVLPGSENSELARFGGEMRAFEMQPKGFCLDTHDRGEEVVPPQGEAFLVLGVVDPEQRADSQGEARADRGKTYGHLFWKVDDKWVRFLLNASRTNYVILGDKKENSAIRNFRLLILELKKVVPQLKTHKSVDSLEQDLRATHYKSLAEFEARACQLLGELD